MTSFIVTLTCPDKPGIVAALSRVLAENGFNITESQQYSDMEHNRFFMRVACDGLLAQADLENALRPIGDDFNMQLRLYPADARLRVLILVSKFDHCLIDLIYRQQNGSLNMDIAAVASNHEIGRQWADNAQLPYHALGGKEAKAENETKLTALIEQENIDLIILARYMQVLTAPFVDRYSAQIINIHHSFLPSFKGAEPYSQAHARGVKLIGATAHFVTAELDEGPIITQGVEPVRHDMSVSAFIDVGRDTERRALARAVRLYTERRVFLNGGKTVIFD
jgi:formyltetrahydrofolate deformylase